MKAIIGSTYDDQYLFYLPITSWLWHKLGVDVICFLPSHRAHETEAGRDRLRLALSTINNIGIRPQIYFFRCPEHKEATYAQCSRLYSGCLSLQNEEISIVSDIDMALFKIPENKDGFFSVFGSDLVPDAQYPMCFLSASHIEWWETFECGDKSSQQCLDELLGDIECEGFRGNYWGKDQEEAFSKISNAGNPALIPRARPGTQFASNRIDRDDAYFMDRLSPDIIDYHMHRPGYTDDNFEKIINVIKYFYPNDDLAWMRNYQQSYKELVK